MRGPHRIASHQFVLRTAPSDPSAMLDWHAAGHVAGRGGDSWGGRGKAPSCRQPTGRLLPGASSPLSIVQFASLRPRERRRCVPNQGSAAKEGGSDEG